MIPLYGFVLLLGIASGVQQFLLGILARHEGVPRAVMLSVAVSVAMLAVFLIVRALTHLRRRSVVREGAAPLLLAAASVAYLLEGGRGHDWYLYGPGLLGLLIVGGLAYAVPRLGTGAVFTVVVMGQMAASLLLDQLGILGLPRLPVGPLRLAGATLLVAGVLLILRREPA